MNAEKTFGSINPVSRLGTNNTGGALTIYQRVLGIMSWKNIIIGLSIVSLIILSYYIYSSYAKGKTIFNANRENNATDVNSNKDATLMLFYVDWCPHCVKGKPEWESLKSEYDGKSINGYTVNFVEYNCTKETDEITQMIEKYSIEGYPTIKLVKDQQVIEYDAKMIKSTMVQFLNTVL